MEETEATIEFSYTNVGCAEHYSLKFLPRQGNAMGVNLQRIVALSN